MKREGRGLDYNREYDPIEAAYAVAQFLPADPALWVERCALAGIVVGLTPDGRLFEMYVNGDVRADPSQREFLASWLNLTPGGKEAVIAYLDRRDSPRRHKPNQLNGRRRECLRFFYRHIESVTVALSESERIFRLCAVRSGMMTYSATTPARGCCEAW